MLRFLHISDTHFGIADKTGEQGRITDALVQAAHKSGISPDFCIFSGDLAQSGSREQFRVGEEWLVKLLQHWPKAKLLVVPGNHDVERRLAKINTLRNAGQKLEAFEEWIEPPTATHLQSFFEWHKSALENKRLPLVDTWADHRGFVVEHTTSIVPITFIGMNSSLLSCGDSDKGNLCVDLPSLNQHLRVAANKKGLTVAIMHHPLEDLADWNKEQVIEILSRENGAHLLIHGHLHDQTGKFFGNSTGSSLGILGSGAAYQGSRWPQTFAFYEIDFTRRELLPKVFSFSRNAGEWVEESELSRPIVLNIPLIPRSAEASALSLTQTKPTTEKSLPNDSRNSPQGPNGHQPATDQQQDLQAWNDRIQLEVWRHTAAGDQVRELMMRQLSETATIYGLCYSQTSRLKKKNRILEKIKTGNLKGPGDLVDICGIRLVTYFSSEIANVLSELIEMALGRRLSSVDFVKGRELEVRIHSSRPEGDPLSISSAIRKVVMTAGPAINIVERSHPTGYSSIHFIAWVRPPSSDDHQVEEMRIEFQLRSALEELWGAVDHKLRYGSVRGKTGVTWQRHLNIFKTLVDGLLQYVDEIKRQAEGELLTPPPETKNASSINTPSKELEQLKGLPSDIFEKMEGAYDLWKRADASRLMGGDPGLFRQAADAFRNILSETESRTIGDPQLALRLKVVATAEQAYLLMDTGDKADLTKSASLYQQIQQMDPTYFPAFYRLGLAQRRLEEYAESRKNLNAALQMLRGGSDPTIKPDHEIHFTLPLALALTEWRIFQDTALSADDRSIAIKDAIEQSKAVYESAAPQGVRTHALNDLLYYCWEQLDAFGVATIPEAEITKLCRELEKDMKPAHQRYEYYDTLQRCYRMIKDTDNATRWATVVRSGLGEVAMQKKGLTLPSDPSSYMWTLAANRALNNDQSDALAFAQDILNTRLPK